MNVEMGEYLVGAYLKLERGCDVVDYNVRAPGGGRRGLQELDVIGLDFAGSTAYLCEVATHIRGLDYGGYAETAARVARKFASQKAYAQDYLGNFPTARFEFWSPNVPVGALSAKLEEIEGLDLVINGVYRERVEALQRRAAREPQETGNPFFRGMQILASLRG
jgi:hypothetical protein